MYGPLPASVVDRNQPGERSRRRRDNRTSLAIVLFIAVLLFFTFASLSRNTQLQTEVYRGSDDLAAQHAASGAQSGSALLVTKPNTQTHSAMKKLSEQQVAQQAASAARFEAQFSGKAQELRRWKWRAEPDASLVRIVDLLSQDDRRTRNWLLATRPQSQRGYPIGLTSVHPSEPRRSLQQSAQPKRGEGPGEFTNGSWGKYGELLHEWHGGQQPVGTDRQAWYEPYSRLHAEIMQGERHGGVLEYWCPEDRTCGGLADRMLGMTTTLLFALLSGRAFTATWGQPFPMELLFDSPFIDWSSPLTSLGEGSAPTDVFPPLWSNDTLLKHRQTVLLINTEAAKSEEVLDQLTTASKLSSEPRLRLDRLNRGLTLNTFRTPKHLERLSSLGLTMHTAYAQLIHFLFRPKLEALTFIAEYTSVFALPSMFVVGIQVRTGDLYMRDPEQDKINTVERHAHWFQCAQEVVETYSHPSQRPLYFLVTDSATLRSSAAATYPDRVVTTGLRQRHTEPQDQHVHPADGKIREDTGSIIAELDGMMGTVAESWAFSTTWKRAKPNRAIVLTRVSVGMKRKVMTPGTCRLESALADFEDLGTTWSLG
ncbi:hypothetical protein JCM3770_006971 [Rhodotorula araucariae]